MDRFQDDKTRFSTEHLTLLDEALIKERGESVKNVNGKLFATYGLYRFQRAASAKDGQPREQHLFALIQQIVAPVKRAAERPLAGGQVTRTAGERAQAAIQPRQQHLRW